MKTKVFIITLTMMLALTFTSFADDWKNTSFLDPFNNDLFEVVTEIKIPKEIIEKYPNFSYIEEFDFTRKIFNDDGTKYKDVQFITDYSGKITAKELMNDYVPFDRYAPNEVNTTDEGVFNDGLVHQSIEVSGEDINYYNSDMVFSDINGSEIYRISESNNNVKYNLGIIGIVHDFETDEGNSTKKITKFIKLMTDKSEYNFLGSIGIFNDDGYAIYQTNDEIDKKYYVIKLKKGIIPTVTYNSAKIAFDQIPLIKDDRTLVPLRAIFETLGASVSWNDETQTVIATKEDTKISLTIGDNIAYKNDEEILLDVPALVINDRTMVPVRFIADSFGINVFWNDSFQRVELN